MENIKIVVKKEFVDRYTGKKHRRGEKLTITDERLREIRRSGDYVTVEKAEEKPKK